MNGRTFEVGFEHFDHFCRVDFQPFGDFFRQVRLEHHGRSVLRVLQQNFVDALKNPLHENFLGEKLSFVEFDGEVENGEVVTELVIESVHLSQNAFVVFGIWFSVNCDIALATGRASADETDVQLVFALPAFVAGVFFHHLHLNYF